MSMKVRDIMVKDVLTAEPDVNLREAAEVMADNHVGCLVVVENGKLTGIVTDRDILLAVADSRKNLDKMAIKDVMTHYVITTSSDTPIEKAIQLMIENKVKKVPVVDGGELSGILTMTDVVLAQPKLIEKFNKIIKKK
jgi:CBS domain-containing protein